MMSKCGCLKALCLEHSIKVDNSLKLLHTLAIVNIHSKY